MTLPDAVFFPKTQNELVVFSTQSIALSVTMQTILQSMKSNLHKFAAKGERGVDERRSTSLIEF